MEHEADQQQQQQQLALPTAALLALHAAIWQQQAGRQVVEQLLAGINGRSRVQCDALMQQAVLDVLCSPLSKAAPPSVAFVGRLVKQLISAAEEGGQELSEPLLQLQVALLQQASAAQGDGQEISCAWRYKTFYYSSSPCGQQLQQLQRQQAGCIFASKERCSWGGAAQGQEQQQRRQQSGYQAQQQQQWVLPAHLQQRLRQQQCALQQLFEAAGLLQKQHAHAACSCKSPSPQLPPPEVLADASRPSGSSNSSSHAGSAGVCSSSAGLVTIHASDNMFEGSTGCFMWDAGFLLAEFVLNHPHIFAGRCVLEVGCGPGLVATCLCRVGASRVVLTDGDPQTLVNCLSNLTLNGHPSSALLGRWQEAAAAVDQGGPQQPGSPDCAGTQVLACPLDWHEDVPGLAADVVVGSDVCYEPDAVPSLVHLLQQLLGGGHSNAATGAPPPRTARGAVAYIATTRRHPSTLQLFLDQAAAAGLEVTEVPKQPGQWPVDGSSSSSGSGAAGVVQPAVLFQHLPALAGAEARERYVLHRVVARHA